MKIRTLFALLLVLVLLLSGCETASDSEDTAQLADEQDTALDSAGLFSDRDREGSFDESSSAVIELTGASASCSSSAVEIDGSTVTITDEGTYLLRGTLDDGMIIVDAEKTDKTQLVLDGVSIHSETSAPIYVLQADKVFITLADSSNSTLSNGGTFTAIDDNNIDAVIFSKEDLTVNGTGSLTVTSPAGHGIVSKDELTVAGGSIEIVSASHGLSGKDNICITEAALRIASGKDGIQAENDEDASLGFVYIESGSFEISSEGDGISASASLQILDGSFDIVSGGGSENSAQHSSDSWGSFMEGGHGGGGGRPGGGDFGGGFDGNTASVNTEENDTSIKGIKASGRLTISGGDFIIDSADDAVHSNSDLTVNGGTFEIATGDDGFHADKTLTVTAGTIHISESYEGLEGLCIDISGGDITLTATDDGLNAAGGTDQSGFGGPRGGDMFGSSNSGSYIRISGGRISIHASGDGIDSNGTLSISGGMVTVCGPTSGDTAVLDYETTGTISGGTFIGTGSYMMAQTFSSSENQGVIAVSVGNQPAGTLITLTDAEKNTVISYSPGLSFAIVILSSPDIIKGESYTITVGEASGEFTAG